MNKSECMEILAFVDNGEKPSSATIQAVAAAGDAKAVHAAFRAAMMSAGWNVGGARTIEDALLTPHIRPWEHLNKGQRDSFRALLTLRVTPKWESAKDSAKEGEE